MMGQVGEGEKAEEMKHVGLKFYLLLNDVPAASDCLGIIARFNVREIDWQSAPLNFDDAAHEWLKDQRKKAIDEFTLIMAALAVLFAGIAAFRC